MGDERVDTHTRPTPWHTKRERVEVVLAFDKVLCWTCNGLSEQRTVSPPARM